MTGGQTVTAAEVAKHNSATDCWIIVDGVAYDVTAFLSDHPGGRKVLVNVAGTDASKKFHAFHKPSVMHKYGPGLQVGKVTGGEAAASVASASGAPAKPSASKAVLPAPSPPRAASSPPSPASGAKSSTSASSFVRSSSSSSSAASASSSALTPSPSQSSRYFGEQVPYGDAPSCQGWHSPYYQPHHHTYRAAIRDFVDREIMPNCHDWDEAKEMPRSLFVKMAEAGILQGVCGPPWPTALVGDKLAGGLRPEQFDVWAELIAIEEVSRCGSGGVVWGLFGGLSIGLPPVQKFGSKALQQKVVRPCLMGEKVICLAITEPYAGSDVASIQCEAKLSADGTHYVVNGEKKWITNGVFADFFTVAVRTGGKGMKGISLLLIERGEGVTTKQMKCQGVWSSGTTYITFEDVRVPVSNLIGKENDGFKYIMYNFNHERWSICVQSCRFARVCLEEAMRYSFKRRTFGKLLIEHPVIRLKLAHMARQVEATWAMIENITYQMSVMSFQEQAKTLGGPIALCKAQSTTVLEYCAREASQTLGGLSYTRGGQGEKVERLYREVRAFAIPGGSEEIMLDLGIRQGIRPYAMRLMQQEKESKM